MLIALSTLEIIDGIFRLPATMLGASLVFSATRRGEAAVPLGYASDYLTRCDYPWVTSACGVIFEMAPLNSLFRIFAETVNRRT